MVALFILPFVLALSGALVFSGVLSVLRSRLTGLRIGPRHRHTMLSRFGGVAIIGAFFVAVFLDQHLALTKPLWGFLIGSLCIFFFGIIDDLFELDWRTQLLFQVALGVIIFLFSLRIDFITNPFGGVIDFSAFSAIGLPFAVTLAWLLLIMNAVNWLDGADGLLGGVGSIAALTIFFISLRPEVNQPPIAILSIALLGAILGFLLFNFPPARILAGTTGSMFIGFSLAVLAMVAGSKIATTMLVLAVPIIDAILVAISRIFSGDSVFQPDERHIHFRLMRLGWSPRTVFFSITLLTGLVAYIAVQASLPFKIIAFIGIMAFLTGFFIFVERSLRKH